MRTFWMLTAALLVVGLNARESFAQRGGAGGQRANPPGAGPRAPGGGAPLPGNLGAIFNNLGNDPAPEDVFGAMGNFMGSAISGQAPGPPQGPPEKLELAGKANIPRELQLSRQEIDDVAKKWKSHQELVAGLKTLSADEQAVELAKLSKANDEWLSTALRAPQWKRLQEIAIQQRGIRALLDPETAKRLDLTADQSRRLQEVHDGNAAETKALSQNLFNPVGNPQPAAPGGAGARMAAQVQALPAPLQGLFGGAGGAGPMGDMLGMMNQMADNMEKLSTMGGSLEQGMLDVLTPSQKTKWTELKGAPFRGAQANPADLFFNNLGGGGNGAGNGFNFNFNRGGARGGNRTDRTERGITPAPAAEPAAPAVEKE